MLWIKKYINIIEIQDKYIKCLGVLQSSRKYDVLKTAIGNLNPDSKDEATDQIAYIIKSLLMEIGSYPPKNLILSLNGRDAIIRSLELPPINNEKFIDLDNMIRYELSTHLPLSLDQTCYNYQILSIDSEKTKVLTAAIKRSILNKLLDNLSMSGIYPDIITISSLILFNAFAIKGLIDNGLIGLVYLRSSGGDIVISESGYISYARSFSIQEGTDKESVLKELSNSFETYYRSRPKTQRNIASNINIVLEGNKLPLGITENNLSRISPNSQCKLYDDFDDLTLAMAIMGSDKVHENNFPSLIRVNLLEQIIQENKIAKKKAIKIKFARIAPTITLVILLIISLVLVWQNYKLKERLFSEENRVEKYNSVINNIKEIKNTKENLDEKIMTFNWLSYGYPLVSYRMYKIATEIPDSLWLKEIYIPEIKTSKKKNEDSKYSILYVVGYARDQGQIDYFINRLKRCGCFNNVRQESTSEVLVSNEKLLEFKIALISEPGK